MILNAGFLGSVLQVISCSRCTIRESVEAYTEQKVKTPKMTLPAHENAHSNLLLLFVNRFRYCF
jgi:hypothetical protein